MFYQIITHHYCRKIKDFTFYCITFILYTAVFLAVKNSNDIKISKVTINIQNKAYFYELRKFLPNLSFGFNNANNISFDSPDTRSANLSMGIDMLLFDGGKMIVNYMTNKADLEFSKKDIMLKITRLQYEIKNKYNSLLILYEKERIQEDLLKISLIQEKNAELELGVGSISKVDYYDIKLKVKQIEVDLEKIKREKNNELTEFRHVLGIDNMSIELARDINYVFLDLSYDYIPYLQSIAMSRRLDLKQSSHTILKNKIQYTYSILSFLPEVRSGFNFVLSDEKFPPRNKSFTFNLDIKIPLAYFPVNYSPKLGSEGNKASRSVDDGAQVSAAQNLTYENDILKSKLELATSGIKNDELIRTVKNDIRLNVENYIESLKIYRLKLTQNEFGRKKIEIMRLKLQLGEVTRVDLLKEEMEYNKSIIEEKTMLFELMSLESKLQDNLGTADTNLDFLIAEFKKNL